MPRAKALPQEKIMSAQTTTVAFHKLHGCGNDFVFIDNRQLALPVEAMEQWAIQICRKAFGVGADGLVFLENAPEGPEGLGADYRWHFYNADGSRAEMCGNASRCASLLAVELGFAGTEHSFLTDAGIVRAKVDVENSSAKVELTAPCDAALNTSLTINGQDYPVQFVNTGVPHAVVFLESAEALAALDIRAMGLALRSHEHYAPAGTNANFAAIIDPTHIHLRTYERGVEDETYACGTGSAATAYLANALGQAESSVSIKSSGGEILGIDLEGGVFLSGKAVKVFTGELNLASVGLSI